MSGIKIQLLSHLMSLVTVRVSKSVFIFSTLLSIFLSEFLGMPGCASFIITYDKEDHRERKLSS